MAKLRAALLAAGRGVRMGGGGPKTLVRVGGDEPLLAYILAGLGRAGVSDLLVVTGFRPKEVQDYVSQHWPGEATFVANARWASWGNFHSVRVALDQSPGMDLLVVNSDIILAPEVYRRVIEGDGDLVLAVQRRSDLDPEDMRVELAAERVVAISKDLPRSAGHGEFCGVSLIRPRAARPYLEVATTLQWEGATGLYYEDVYGRIRGEVEAVAAPVEAGEYAEVDEPADLAAAEAVLERHRDAFAPAQRTGSQ